MIPLFKKCVVTTAFWPIYSCRIRRPNSGGHLFRKTLTDILIHITYDVNVVLATKDKNNDLQYWNRSWDNISIIECIRSINSHTVFLCSSVNILVFGHSSAYQCFKRCHHSNDTNLAGTQALDLTIA